MKRLITSMLVIAIVGSPASALAQPLAQQSDLTALLGLKAPASDHPAIFKPKAPDTKPSEPTKPAAVVYAVVKGDNLSKIGTANNVEWQRLWAKNMQLQHPDIIHVGDQITIPDPAEQLSRELPAAVSLPAETPGVTGSPAAQAPGRVYDAGNTYDYGYCTWYVKNRRGASLPNSLGNANTWYSRAAALGMAVGSAPRAGAVGTTTRGSLGHVVYVESVNADGSINISEMNYQGFGITSYRTTGAGEFLYIY